MNSLNINSFESKIDLCIQNTPANNQQTVITHICYAIQDPLCRKSTMLLMPSIRDIAIRSTMKYCTEEELWPSGGMWICQDVEFLPPMTPLRCLLTTFSTCCMCRWSRHVDEWQLQVMIHILSCPPAILESKCEPFEVFDCQIHIGIVQFVWSLLLASKDQTDPL